MNNKVVWHVRYRYGFLRQWFPSYCQLSKEQLERIPDEYWQDDPIYHTKIESQSLGEQLIAGSNLTYAGLGDNLEGHTAWSVGSKVKNSLPDKLNPPQRPPEL